MLLYIYISTCTYGLINSFFVLDSEGQRNKYSMIQYLFEGPEIDIKIKPHGNSKGNSSFFRTATSTKKRIQQLASSSTPKAVVSQLTQERGGEIEARGLALLPRDCRQVSYARQKQSKTTCDPLYSIMLECKLAQGTSNVFVQDVKAAPYPMSVSCFQWQIQDMVRFLTCNHNFSVLTVDTTYKLGDFLCYAHDVPQSYVGGYQDKKAPGYVGPTSCAPKG